jgi:hypothetical protein
MFSSEVKEQGLIMAFMSAGASFLPVATTLCIAGRAVGLLVVVYEY